MVAQYKMVAVEMGTVRFWMSFESKAIEFNDGLNVGCERKRIFSDNNSVLGLNKRKEFPFDEMVKIAEERLW